MFEFIDSGAPREVGKGEGESGDTQGAAGGVELGVIRAFCMKVSTRCDIGERRSPFRPPEVVARCETNPNRDCGTGGVTIANQDAGPVEK